MALSEGEIDSIGTSTRLLAAGEPQPAMLTNRAAKGRFLLLGDHAGRRVPRALAALGLPAAELERHIAWDIGVAGVGEALAQRLGACFAAQRYSRLVIDCNRDPGRADSIVEESDGTRVPGNLDLPAQDRAARRSDIFEPYHQAVGGLLDERAPSTLLVSIHSFTPVMGGFTRPWRFGVLHQDNSAFSKALLAELRAAAGEAVVGDNEPYAMDNVDYTIPFHAGGRGLDYVELEINQALIADAHGQAQVADFVAPLIERAARRL